MAEYREPHLTHPCRKCAWWRTKTRFYGADGVFRQQETIHYCGHDPLPNGLGVRGEVSIHGHCDYWEPQKC